VLWLGLVAGTLVVAFVFLRYRHVPRTRAWDSLLTGSAARVAVTSELDQATAEYAWEGAVNARRQRDQQEAVRLLQLAYQVIQEATPQRLTRLRAMARASRMALAIMPLPPVPPLAFRLRQVKAAASLGAMLHLVMLPAQRFLVRLRVLSTGFRLTARSLQRSKAAAARRPVESRAWVLFEAGLSDWNTLDFEHVQSFRALMAALAGELRAETAPRPAA